MLSLTTRYYKVESTCMILFTFFLYALLLINGDGDVDLEPRTTVPTKRLPVLFLFCHA